MKKISPIIWILLIGLTLRLISLNQSLWLDEGIQWWAVTAFPFKHLVTEYIKGDFNPPLYHALMFFWVRAFGTSEIALRFPSVLFGLGTIHFTYKLAQLLPKKKLLEIRNLKLEIPEVAALLTATSGLLVYYSQEARMYSLAAFATTATMYFLMTKSKAKYILSAIIMLYSHYLTWLLVPMLLLQYFLPTVAALASLLPWLPILWPQLHQGLGAAGNPAWAKLSSLSVKNVLLIPTKFLIGRIPVDFTPAYIIPLGILSILVTYLIFKAKNKFLYSWFFVPLMLGAIISLKVPVFIYFRFLFIIPAFYLLIVQGSARFSHKIRTYLLWLFLVINLVSSIWYLGSSKNHREDWKSATRYTHIIDSHAPVIVYSPVHPPFDYYNQSQLLMLNEHQLDQIINQSDAWFITYAQPIFDPQNNVRQTLASLGFQAISQKDFRGVTVIRYKNFSAKLFSFVPR